MPDLPIPEDAAEAALFSECWDAVLSYADLCTAGSAAAGRLAAEAFARGMREARTTGRRPARLPRVPLLLTAVRATAASWEAAGRGQDLDPDLKLWLHSPRAARYTGPPRRRPLALRALGELRAPDAELLWLADVEALPLTVVARRLGLDPATAAGRLDGARARFRDRCRRAHLDTPADGPCHGYAALLDAATRTPGAGLPEDLSRHLAICADCAEAAACLRPHGTAPAAALASGVVGWNGAAYLERRRRAADARLGTPGPGPAGPGDDHHDRPGPGGHRAKLRRGGLLGAAALVSLLALGVTLMPFGSAAGPGGAEPAGTTGRRTGAEPEAAPPPPPVTARARPSAAGTTGAPEATPGRRPSDPDPAPAPRDTATAPPPATGPATTPAASPDCRIRYELVDQWPDGFQAAVTLTTARALDTWRVSWTFPDGQRVTRMWDATADQDGPRVTADAADYHRAVPAGGKVGFGFLASWRDRNSPPRDFTLNGRACAAD
ncbi:cellulose-binding domain-containing protein [Streptomyces fumanus]|uniref:CBM2 domain-containing protein n=1 Tax=Streptomyces fumanus TaxID=67302 RepID=A0A919AJL0_9ACTN|nr:cellulose-binding domain-containing protein [Streptomyces fumanus]GHF11308.1 hypothetical protein GCM10018772_40490 [Streptomyces fumanus]